MSEAVIRKLLEQVALLIKVGDEKAAEKTLEMVLPLGKRENHGLSARTIALLIDSTTSMAERYIQAGRQHEAMALLGEARTIALRDSLVMHQIALGATLAKLIFSLVGPTSGAASTDLRKVAAECSTALYLSYRYGLMDHVETVSSLLDRAEAHFMAKTARYSTLYRRLNLSLQESTPTVFSSTLECMERLVDTLISRHEFQLARELIDEKVIGQCLAASKFGSATQEKFLFRAVSAGERLNEAQLNPAPAKPAQWRSIRQSVVSMRDSITPESVALPTISGVDFKLIKETQARISEKYRSIIQGIVDYSLVVAGPPPCEFCLLGLGSLSRNEASVFSDVEFGLIYDEEALQNSPTSSVLVTDEPFSESYFGKLLNIMEFAIACVGEPTGFRFDSQGTPFEFRLRGSPTTIVSRLLGSRCVDAQSVAIISSVVGSSLLYSSTNGAPLFDKYLANLRETLNTPIADFKSALTHSGHYSMPPSSRELQYFYGLGKFALSDHIGMLKGKKKAFNRQSVDLTSATASYRFVHLKDDYIMPLICIIQDLSILFGVRTTIPMELAKDGASTAWLAKQLAGPESPVFHPMFTSNLRDVLAAMFSIRIRCELAQREQVGPESIMASVEASISLQSMALLPIHSKNVTAVESMTTPKHIQDSKFKLSHQDQFWLYVCEWAIQKPLYSVLHQFIESSDNIMLIDPVLNLFEAMVLNTSRFSASECADIVKGLAVTLFVRQVGRRNHMHYFKKLPHQLMRLSYRSAISELQEFRHDNEAQVLLKDILSLIDLIPEDNGTRAALHIDSLPNWRARLRVPGIQRELMNSFEMANNSSPHDHSPTGAVRLLDDYIVEVNPIRGGMEYAASILANRVSSYGTAPYVDLVVINGVIVLVTQRIQGMNLKQSKMMEIQVEKRPEKQAGTSRSPNVTPQKDDPSQLKQSSIDQRTFTEAVIMAIILSSLDGAPSNYLVRPYRNPSLPYEQQTTSYCLVAATNRNCFEDVFCTQGDRIGIRIKNALFCLDKMNDLCDEEAVEEFAVLNAEQVIEAWLSDLHDKQAELSQYGADTSMFELLEDAPVKIYSTMVKIQNAVRQRNFSLTHMDLLRVSHPTLANCYSSVLKRDLPPMKRFHSISNKHFTYSDFISRIEVNERLTQLQAISDVIDNVSTKALAAPAQLSERLKAYLSSKKLEQSMQKLVVDATAATFASSGNLPQFISTLQSADPMSRERILAQVDFATASTAFIDSCLTMLASGGGLTELRLRNCATLDNTRFIAILKNSPNISVLDLRGCKKVSHGHLIREDALKELITCKSLTYLDLSETLIKYFAFAESYFPRKLVEIKMPSLRWLTLDDCGNLAKILIDAPNLRHLSARHSPYLRRVKVYPAPGAGADFEGCDLIVAPELLQQSLSMSTIIHHLVEELGIDAITEMGDILDLLLFIVTNKGKELAITGRQIVPAVVRALMGALKLNSTMEILFFTQCNLTEESCLEIVRALDKHPKMRQLSFVKNNLNKQAQEKIVEVSQNKSIKIQFGE